MSLAAAAKATDNGVALLERGESFSFAGAGLKGRHFEIVGRAIAGDAVLRMRDVSGDRLQLLRLNESHARGAAALTKTLRKPASICSRIRPGRATRDGAIEWVNTAYVRAVEAADASGAFRRNLELFDSAALADAAAGSRAGRAPGGRERPRRSAGERRMFEAYEI